MLISTLGGGMGCTKRDEIDRVDMWQLYQESILGFTKLGNFAK